MDIALCSTRDLLGCLILNELYQQLQPHRLTLWLADKPPALQHQRVPELATMRFLERDLLLAVLFPLIDQGPAPEAPLYTFEGLRRRVAGLHVLSDRHQWDGGSALAHARYDLVVSARFGFIFSAATIAALGPHLYNLHPGALPSYGGQMPVLRACLNGDRQLGCTLHQITASIDAGPIVDLCYLTRREDRSQFYHRWQVYKMGIARVAALVERLAEGQPITTTPQPIHPRVNYPWPDQATFAAAQAQGVTLLAWAEYLALLQRFSSRLTLP